MIDTDGTMTHAEWIENERKWAAGEAARAAKRDATLREMGVHLDNHESSPVFKARAEGRLVEPKGTAGQGRFIMVLLKKLDAHNPRVARLTRETVMPKMQYVDATAKRPEITGVDMPRAAVSSLIDDLNRHLTAPADMVDDDAPAPVVAAPTINPRAELQRVLDALPPMHRHGTRFALNMDGHWRHFWVKTSKMGKRYIMEGRGGGFEDLIWDFLPAEHGAVKIAKLIMADPKTAMLDFGHHFSHCGHCGRTLTNDASKAAGLGPWCRNKPETAWLGMSTR